MGGIRSVLREGTPYGAYACVVGKACSQTMTGYPHHVLCGQHLHGCMLSHAEYSMYGEALSTQYTPFYETYTFLYSCGKLLIYPVRRCMLRCSSAPQHARPGGRIIIVHVNFHTIILPNDYACYLDLRPHGQEPEPSRPCHTFPSCCCVLRFVGSMRRAPTTMLPRRGCTVVSK